MNRETLFNLSMMTLRSIIGVIFLIYGLQKLFGMFDGIGLAATAKMVEGLGLSNAYIVAFIWASIEFIGGIFLIFGIFARWAAISIVFTMLVRLWKINLLYGFFVQDGGVEYNILVIGACIPIILLGGGSWSVWDI